MDNSLKYFWVFLILIFTALCSSVTNAQQYTMQPQSVENNYFSVGTQMITYTDNLGSLDPVYGIVFKVGRSLTPLASVEAHYSIGSSSVHRQVGSSKVIDYSLDMNFSTFAKASYNIDQYHIFGLFGFGSTMFSMDDRSSCVKDSAQDAHFAMGFGFEWGDFKHAIFGSEFLFYLPDSSTPPHFSYVSANVFITKKIW